MAFSTCIVIAGTFNPTAFVCHYNVFIVYGCMKEKSIENISLACHSAVAISYLLSLILGIAGYVTFMDYTQGNARYWIVMSMYNINSEVTIFRSMEIDR